MTKDPSPPSGPALLLIAALACFAPAAAQDLVPIPRPAKDTAAKAVSAESADTIRPKSGTPPAEASRPGAAASARGADTAARAPGSAAARPPGDTASAAAGAPAVPDTLQPGAAAPAGDAAAAGDTVAYSAVRIRYRNDRFSLSDKALLTYRGSSMIADSIVYWSKDNIVEAMGAPLIQDPTNPPILGYRMRYNLKTKVGEIYYGSSQKGNQSFNGVEVRRQPNGDVYIARGDFSTCVLPYKHYYFYSRRMILEPKSKVLSGPIVMDIAEVPVAVLPMIVMPLGTGRRSGMLQPKIGGDQAQGFFMNNIGYYWAINDYMDYKLAGDVIEGEQGTFDRTNINSLYRYNVRYLLNGSLDGTYYLSEFDPSQAGWSLRYANDWNITPDQKQTLKGSGTFQSDPDVVFRNTFTEEERSQQTANADLGYRRQFDSQGANLGVSFNQNYNLTTGNLTRTLPNVTLSMGGPLFPEPREEAEADPYAPRTPAGEAPEDPWYRKLEYNYSSAGNAYYVRTPTVLNPATPGIPAVRGDSNTFVGYRDDLTLSGKFQAFRYINLNPSVNAGQMWSLDSKDPTAPGGSRNAWDPSTGDLGEYFPHFSTGVSADTRFYGIALAGDDPWFGSVMGVRHTVVPRVGFTYAPEIDTNPRFVPNPGLGQGVAYQAEQRTVTLGLENEVDLKLKARDTSGKRADGADAAAAAGTAGKGKEAPYKLGSTASNVSYNIANRDREWSPIGSSFTVYLTPKVPFTIATTHMLYDDFAAGRNSLVSPILTAYNFSWRKGLEVGGNFNSGLRLRDTQGYPGARFDQTPWSANLNYNFQFSSRRVGGGSSNPVGDLFGVGGIYEHSRSHSATGGLKLNPTKSWEVTYDTEYDFSQGSFSRHAFLFHRTLHCWDMDFRWTPVGLAEGWSFIIRITELPDVKLESRDTKARRR